MDEHGLTAAFRAAVAAGRPLSIEHLRITGGPSTSNMKIEGRIVGCKEWVQLDCVRGIAFDPITVDADITARLDVYVELLDLRSGKVDMPISVRRMVFWRLKLRAGLVRSRVATELGRMTGQLVGRGQGAASWIRTQWARLVAVFRPRLEAAKVPEAEMQRGWLEVTEGGLRRVECGDCGGVMQSDEPRRWPVVGHLVHCRAAYVAPPPAAPLQ